MELKQALRNLVHAGPQFRQAAERGNLRVLSSLLGPACRGLVKQTAKGAASTVMAVEHGVNFDWDYTRDQLEMTKLYEAAKVSQWNATTDVDWKLDVDLDDPQRPLLPDDYMPVSTLPAFRNLRTHA